MGNSLFGFKSNLNLIQSKYVNLILEAIFQDIERVDFLLKKISLS